LLLLQKLSPISFCTKTTTMIELQYPVGKHVEPAVITPELITQWIDYLEAFPAEFLKAAESLSAAQLETPYRPDGWNGRQVIHHVADSHMQALGRVKMALTEDWPTIKPYEEAEFALLADYHLPIGVSLSMIEGVHQHLVSVLRSIADWSKGYVHPAYGKRVRLDSFLSLYDWHSRHHLGHLKILQNK
jgi:hypothetical protein